MATKERRKKKSQNLGYQQEPYPKENELIEKQVLLAVQQSPETEKKEDVSTIQFSRQDQGVKSSLPTPEDKIDIKALKVSKTVVSPTLGCFLNDGNFPHQQTYIEEILHYNTEQQYGSAGAKFNVPYQMIACIPKYMPLQISKVPMNTLDNISDEIPMEKLRLFVNHGSIYEFKDKNSQIQKFALYSPRIGTCVILTEEGKKVNNEMFHHAASVVQTISFGHRPNH